MLILLMLPLGFMLILTVFTLIFVQSSGNVALFGVVDTSAIINGTTTTLTLTDTPLNFSFDPLLSALTWIIVLVILAGVIGFNAVATGLNSSSSKIIVVGTAWSTAYIFLGIWGYPLIVAIPYSWGELMYISLTVVYAFGVFKQIGAS